MNVNNINDFLTCTLSLWHHKIIKIGDNFICLNNLVFAAILIILGIRNYARFSSAFKKRIDGIFVGDKDMSHAVSKMCIFSITSLYWILVLQVANIPLSAFAFVGGALAIGLGFGTKNIISNLIGSFIMIIEKPMKIGDLVSINGNVGKVKDIYGLRSVITTQDNIDLLIPNNLLFQNILVNYTLDNSEIVLCCMLKISKFDKDETHVDTVKIDQFLNEAIKRLKYETKDCAFNSIDAFLFRVLKRDYDYQILYSFHLKDFIDIYKVKNNINIVMSEEISKLNAEFEIVHENISTQFNISTEKTEESCN